jgi:hypothetical protein
VTESRESQPIPENLSDIHNAGSTNYKEKTMKRLFVITSVIVLSLLHAAARRRNPRRRRKPPQRRKPRRQRPQLQITPASTALISMASVTMPTRQY